MIPKNRLGRVLLTKLKVYKGDKHPHAAQQPAALKGRELILNPQPTSMAEIKTPEFLGTGRRKTAVARVRLATGSGKITVNGRAFDNYFPLETLRVDRLPAADRHRHDRQARRAGQCHRRRPERPGRCGAARHRPRAAAIRRQPAARASRRRAS